MVQIVIEFDPGSFILSVTVYGHSGYSCKGSDIVCSGVSALTQSLVIGIEEVLGYSGFASVENDSDFPVVIIRRPEPLDKKLDVLLDTFRLSVVRIAESYPEYVKITEVYN